MKILFLVSSSGHGRGGHIHSLAHISKELGKYHTIQIISLGDSENSILKQNPDYQGFINIFDIGFSKFNSQTKSIVNKFEPDLIHCFDETCYQLALALPCLYSYKFVWTKCGGPSPGVKLNFKGPYMICFSQENYNWYKNNTLFNNAHLYLVQARVNKIELLPEEERSEVKEQAKFNIVRIGRIGKSYVDGFMKILALIKEKHQNYPIQLYIIGTIEDSAIYTQLESYVHEHNLPVKFITDERTLIASKELYLADCVIGTGRSLMEGASIGVPLMTFAENYEYPIVVNRDNIETFAYYNYSERSILSETEIAKANVNFDLMVSNKQYAKELGHFMAETFEERFSVNRMVKAYEAVYKDAIVGKTNQFRLFNILFIIRTLYKSFKK